MITDHVHNNDDALYLVKALIDENIRKNIYTYLESVSGRRICAELFGWIPDKPLVTGPTRRQSQKLYELRQSGWFWDTSFIGKIVMSKEGEKKHWYFDFDGGIKEIPTEELTKL